MIIFRINVAYMEFASLTKFQRHSIWHFLRMLNLNFKPLQAVIDRVERQRAEALSEVKSTRDQKRKVLEEQLDIIQQERTKVDQDVKVREFAYSLFFFWKGSHLMRKFFEYGYCSQDKFT